jgi:hypothetical protein
MMSAAEWEASGDGDADGNTGDGCCCLDRFSSDEEEGFDGIPACDANDNEEGRGDSVDRITGDRSDDEYDDLRLPSLGVRTVDVVVVAAVATVALAAVLTATVGGGSGFVVVGGGQGSTSVGGAGAAPGEEFAKEGSEGLALPPLSEALCGPSEGMVLILALTMGQSSSEASAEMNETNNETDCDNDEGAVRFEI